MPRLQGPNGRQALAPERRAGKPDPGADRVAQGAGPGNCRSCGLKWSRLVLRRPCPNHNTKRRCSQARCAPRCTRPTPRAFAPARVNPLSRTGTPRTILKGNWLPSANQTLECERAGKHKFARQCCCARMRKNGVSCIGEGWTYDVTRREDLGRIDTESGYKDVVEQQRAGTS